jgi:hypothetical protein
VSVNVRDVLVGGLRQETTDEVPKRVAGCGALREVERARARLEVEYYVSTPGSCNQTKQKQKQKQKQIIIYPSVVPAAKL